MTFMIPVIPNVPVTLTTESADETDDYLVIMTHDIIPGMRMVWSRDEWSSFMKWAGCGGGLVRGGIGGMESDAVSDRDLSYPPD